MTRQTKIPIIVAAGLLIAVLAVVVILNFVKARSTSASNACVNNLRQIDSATQQWALELGKTTNDVPTWNDVRSYMGREVHCPAGGTYTLGRRDQPPKCSIGGSGHAL
jgi:hypothetical protein